MNAAARSLLLGAFLLPLGVALVCANDPFHGDAIPNTARPALQLYTLAPPFPLIRDRFDAGHPTLFPLMLAGVWRLTGGPSLVAAHLLAVAWAWSSLWGLWRLARTVLMPPAAAWAVVLAVGGSVALAQVALVQSALAVAGAFVWAWWALRTERRWAFAGAAVVLVLLHLEGMMLLGVLAAVDWVRCWLQGGLPDAAWLRERLIRYGPAGLVFGGWLVAHWAVAGWALVSPEYAGHRGSGGLSTTLYNLALLGWRWFDHGYGLMWIFILFFFFKNKEKISFFRIGKNENSKNKNQVVATKQPDEALTFVVELVVAAGVLTLVLAALVRGPLGHRYVLPVQWGAAVGALVACTHWREVQRWAILGLGLSLLAGHFLVYPGKCLGDATLHYRSWFAIEAELARHWPDEPVATLAPHAAARAVRYLSERRGLNTVRLDEGPPTRLILATNMSCEFAAARRDSLRRVGRALCVRRGAVEAEVFVDSTLAPAALPWGPCPPDAAAAWVRRFKARLLNRCDGC